jgi:hypothetical protein
MVKMNTWKIGVIALAALTAKADTITTRDSRSWNGSVVQIQGGVLQLKAYFASGSPTILQLGANYIRAIEFNATMHNPTAVPNLPPATGGNLAGTVYTGDKKAHSCTDITIDAESVNCAGKSPEKLARQSVMRILIGQ